MQVELRHRSFGELVGLIFSLIAAHFPKLFVINLIVAIPTVIGQAMMAAKEGEEPDVKSMLGGFAVMLLPLILGPIAQGTSILLVASSFTGRPVELGEAVREGMRRALSLVGFGLLSGLVMAFGFLLLFVPGLIFMTWYYIGGPVIVVEGAKAVPAMGRSKELTEGARWTAFGLAIVMALVAFAGAYAVALVGKLLGSPMLIAVLSGFVTAVAGIPAVIAPIVLYFNQRVAREAMDVQRLTALVEAIGKRANPQAA